MTNGLQTFGLRPPAGRSQCIARLSESMEAAAHEVRSSHLREQVELHPVQSFGSFGHLLNIARDHLEANDGDIGQGLRDGAGLIHQEDRDVSPRHYPRDDDVASLGNDCRSQRERSDKRCSVHSRPLSAGPGAYQSLARPALRSGRARKVSSPAILAKVAADRSILLQLLTETCRVCLIAPCR
jgi:hypothetical protein